MRWCWLTVSARKMLSKLFGSDCQITRVIKVSCTLSQYVFMWIFLIRNRHDKPQSLQIKARYFLAKMLRFFGYLSLKSFQGDSSVPYSIVFCSFWFVLSCFLENICSILLEKTCLFFRPWTGCCSQVLLKSLFVSVIRSSCKELWTANAQASCNKRFS